ncbi:MAG: hypothetical protein K8R11_09700 [Methanococcoides sp.]|nr:hypothetical protein [Methanococcoides sp.]
MDSRFNEKVLKVFYAKYVDFLCRNGTLDEDAAAEIYESIAEDIGDSFFD